MTSELDSNKKQISGSIHSNKDVDEDQIAPVPPFQGSKEDKLLTRKRQALFLRQSLLIAERFSRNPVTPSMLASALPWLEREQYDNIAVERNAHGNCGYILCSNPRGASIEQTFRISAQKRRVYDATYRKPFCSDWCYRAFSHVRKQVSPEPGWCRIVEDQSSQPKLSLLPPDASGRPGKLVLDALSRLRLRDVSPPPSQFNHIASDHESSLHSSSDEYSDPSDSESSSDSVSHESSVLDSDDDSERLSGHPARNGSRRGPTRQPVETSWGVEVKPPTRNLVVERVSCDSVATPVEPVPDSLPSSEGAMLVEPDPFRSVAIRLHQWISSKALAVLTTPESISNPSPEPTASSEPEIYVDKNDKNLTCSEQQSVMDPDEQPSPLGILPLIDSVSADTMRRHLLMEALGPCLKSFLIRLGIPSHSILSKLDRAVLHFRLTSKNLHLSRVQRAITSLALLRIMAPSEPSLHALLNDTTLGSLLTTFSDVPVDQFTATVVQPFI